MDIINGNIIICEYMGYTVKKANHGGLVRYKDGKHYGEFEKNGNYYHNDWNMLMPVIKKMQDDGLVKQDIFNGLNDVYDSLLTINIINTWKEVIRTILFEK